MFVFVRLCICVCFAFRRLHVHAFCLRAPFALPCAVSFNSGLCVCLSARVRVFVCVRHRAVLRNEKHKPYCLCLCLCLFLSWKISEDIAFFFRDTCTSLERPTPPELWRSQIDASANRILNRNDTKANSELRQISFRTPLAPSQ